MNDRSVAGRSVRRQDLVDKVTGAAEYAVDVAVPGMIHAKVFRSTRAHARVVAIDIEDARRSPGVVGVVTHVDLHGLFPRFGHIIPDHSILAEEKVRYYGEPVAVVVGETPHAAADALELIQVDYEDLPAVLDATEALQEGATLVHDQTYAATGDDSFKVLTSTKHHTDMHIAHELSNVAHEVELEWGDVESALAAASAVVTSRLYYPMLYAYAMEPYNALASYTDAGLDVVSTAQHPYMVRDDLARIFGLPLSRVRVSAPYLGGGYGSKSYTKVEPLAAVASWVVRRPVKLVLDVEESIYTTRADSADIEVTTGVDADGRIVARVFDIVMDSGAYADNSPLVLAKCVNRCFGPYRVPNLRVRARSVYTNTAPASSYRGFGAPQGTFAGETNLEQVAERLGISPLEIRLRNLVDKDEAILPDKRGLDADIKTDLRMLVDSLERDASTGPFYGIGFACTASDAGAYPVSTASVRIHTDGSATVMSGSTEMGQGSQAVLAQITAQELGIDLRDVRVVQSDTATTPYERTTGASRTTTLVGLAVQRACVDARRKLREMAAEFADCERDSVTDVPGGVVVPDGRQLSFGEVVQGWFGAAAGEVTGVGLLRREAETNELPPFWELGVGGVAVRIDRETGMISIDQLVTVADVGFAINPASVEAQDLGAATQGLGAALYEELLYDGSQLANANVVDYRVPRMKDLPRKVELMVVERRDGIGPYGAKGAGEGALNPMGAAVTAAVARALGHWSQRLPITPERVWRLANGLDVEGPSDG